jgi:hypothetical protein
MNMILTGDRFDPAGDRGADCALIPEARNLAEVTGHPFREAGDEAVATCAAPSGGSPNSF